MRWRFVASGILLCFLFGVLAGRLTEPEALRLKNAQAQADGLEVLFNREPEVALERRDGVLAYRIANSYGRERSGQLQSAVGLVNWRIEREGRDLVLRLVAARPLSGLWQGAEADGLWRVELTLRPE